MIPTRFAPRTLARSPHLTSWDQSKTMKTDLLDFTGFLAFVIGILYLATLWN